MLRRMIVVPILLVGLALLAPQSEVAAKPPRPGGPKGPGGHAAKDLQHAYDRLREVNWFLGADKVKALPQTAELLDSAKELYRNAHQTFIEGDRERAGELAKAAHDAARGLKHSLEAQQPPVAALPAPPIQMGGPLDRLTAGGEAWLEARDQLQRAYDRIQIADTAPAVGGPSRQFMDASRRVYAIARRAYGDGDYPRVAELARAAEAWTHVGEHILRASERGEQFARRPLPPPRPDDRAPLRRPGGAESLPPPLN